MPSPSGSAVVDVTVAPERPDALDAKKPSKQGAIAVSGYFWALFPYAAATGDFAEWDRLADETCKFCSGSREQMADVIDAGGHSEGGAVTTKVVAARENAAGYSYSVAVDLVQQPSTDVDRNGAVIEDYPERKQFSSEVVLHWVDGKWLVAAVDVEEQS